MNSMKKQSKSNTASSIFIVALSIIGFSYLIFEHVDSTQAVDDWNKYSTSLRKVLQKQDALIQEMDRAKTNDFSSFIDQSNQQKKQINAIRSESTELMDMHEFMKSRAQHIHNGILLLKNFYEKKDEKIKSEAMQQFAQAKNDLTQFAYLKKKYGKKHKVIFE